MDSKQKKVLIMLSVSIILLFLFVTILNNSSPVEEPVTEEVEIEVMNQKVENEKVNLLVDKNEEDRMRYYLAQFLRTIEQKEYNKAYELLNADFKDNYFKTYEEFEVYAKSKFPTTISIQYDNFERAGDVYIFWITIFNPLTASKDSTNGIELNFVIKEKDLNDYELSFSVQS